jgi:hypothetical protein
MPEWSCKGVIGYYSGKAALGLLAQISSILDIQDSAIS